MQKLPDKILVLPVFIITIVILADAPLSAQKINPAADMEFVRQSRKTKAHFYKRDYIFKDEKSAVVKYNPVSLTLGGLLYLYQNAFSQQFSASCLYHPSCSEFSKRSIAHYGLFKGVFLSADRLTRCNKVAGLDIHPMSVNPKTHKSEDPIDLYK